MNSFAESKLTESRDWQDGMNAHRKWATDKLTDIEQRITLLESVIKSQLNEMR